MTSTAPRRHGSIGLFAPFVLVLLALAGWTVWWFILAGQVRTKLDLQTQALTRAGWTVNYGRLNVGGWPFHVKLTAPQARFAAPSGHSVAAPNLTAMANAWQPDKWILVAPEGLTLTRPGKGDVAITGQALRASVHGLTQRWPNLAVEMVKPVFTARPGAEAFPIASAQRIEFYLRPHLAPAGSPGVNTSVDVLFRLGQARGRSGGPVEGMANNGDLSAEVESVVERADLLNGPNAAGVLSAWSRGGGRFSAIHGEIAAGQSRAELSSEGLRARADGRIEGQLALKAEKPLPAITGLARSGGGGINRAGAAGAAAATAVAGGSDLDLTLVFKDGRTYLGPFAMAPAPKLF